MNQPQPSESPRKSGYPLLRVLLLALLVLVLEVPVSLIDNLVGERERRRDEAIAEVSAKWGRDQVVAGPMLVVPLARREAVSEGQWQAARDVARGHVVVLPEDLSITGAVKSERRSRGLFSIPVYTADLTLAGHFAPPELAALGLHAEDLDWERAELVVEVGDARAVQSGLTLDWNGESLPFEPSTGLFGGTQPGLHVALGSRAQAAGPGFKIPLSLHGSLNLGFLPLGRTTRVSLTADWPHPSFSGAWLPVTQSVDSERFEAAWEVSYLARDYPQAWRSGTVKPDRLEASRFGVTLFSPVDAYVVTHRSVKYATLFLGLTFLTIWLIDVLAGLEVHAIQYLLVGAALCLFYLLELAFAEQIGVTLAYLVAALAVTLLNGAYCLAVLGRARRAAIVATLMATLYSFLYVLLQEEQYALLSGSVGLFFALALVMYATRRVDWHRLGRVAVR